MTAGDPWARLLAPLRELVAEYVRQKATPDSATDAAFRTYARRISIRNILVIVLCCAVVNLLLWPMDTVVFRGVPEVGAHYGQMRWVLLLFFPALYLAIAWVPALQRFPAATLLLVVAATGLVMGQSVTPFLEDRGLDIGYVIPVSTAAVLVPIGQRALLVLAITAGWMAVIFGLVPENLGASLPGLHVTAWLTSAVAGLAAGHVLYRLTRDNFSARWRLERFTEELERQVAIQSGEIRELSKRSVRLGEDERRHVARELHDDTGQLLHAMRTELDLARLTGGTGTPVALERLEGLTDRLFQSVRRILSALRPQILDETGLEAALQDLAGRVEEASRIPVSVHIDAVPALSHENQLALFRVAQEALTNVMRHAHAAQAQLRLRPADGGAWLSVEDDGEGFDPERATGQGLGLVGMRERARSVGGRLTIESGSGGTTVTVWVPEAEEGE